MTNTEKRQFELENMEIKVIERITLKGEQWKGTELEGKELVVKYAEPKDIDGLVEADKDRAKLRHEKWKTPEKNPVKLKENLEQNLKRSFEKPDELTYYVATVDGEVAGYMEVAKWPDLPENERRICTHSMLIKYQGKHIGSELYRVSEREMLSTIPKLRKLTAGTHDKNNQTIHLNKKGEVDGGFWYWMGFREEGKRRLEDYKWEIDGKSTDVYHITMVKYFDKGKREEEKYE